jgi:hypothetical protein
MSGSLWAPSTSSILGGEAMEDVMRRSLEENAYSVQGFWLWQARAIQQRQHREQGRRRPRSEAGSSMKEEASVGPQKAPRNPAEVTAAQHADDVRSYISALLHATGYPFPALRDPNGKTAPTTGDLEGAVLINTTAAAAVNGVLAASPPPTPSSPRDDLAEASAAAPSDTAPAKAARVEKMGTATSVTASASSPPKSALAKLVAKAKAQHRDAAQDAPTVTVVPAPKHPPSLEEIPGMRLAQGSSFSPSTVSALAERRKRVQFVDESADSAAGGKATRGEGKEESDEEEFGVQLPGHSFSASSSVGASVSQQESTGVAPLAANDAVAAKHPSQMTRAEFLSQFKRAPRRGEIGQTAEDIAAAEKLGYVMSGSRSVASRMYVDRIQRQLHEHEAAKLQQQFRKVEDERMDDQLVHGLADFVMKRAGALSERGGNQ